MRNKHNALIITLLALLVSFLGCGGGSSTSHGAPAISNLSFQATQGPGGTVTVNGTLVAFDTDGNMSTVTFTSSDPLGKVFYTSTDPLPFFNDRAPGPIAITATMNTTVTGTYTFEIYITDSTGLRSNVLTGTFSVI